MSRTTVGSMAVPMKASIACSVVPPMKIGRATPPSARKARQLVSGEVVMVLSLCHPGRLGTTSTTVEVKENLALVTKELTVGEVAARSGLAVSALHFYERKGLIRSQRTSGNQRRYGRDVLRRLAVIRTAQELGVPLGEIAIQL